MTFQNIENNEDQIAYCARERPQMRCSAAGLRSQRPPNN